MFWTFIIVISEENYTQRFVDYNLPHDEPPQEKPKNVNYTL